MSRVVRSSAIRSEPLSLLCLGFGAASIVGSIAIWARTKGQTGESAAHAERFGIFVGLWAPTFLILGDYLSRPDGRDDGRDDVLDDEHDDD